MNIFVLDEDPARAAAQQCDRHVVKMIVESGQLLSTVMHEHGVEGPWRSTHKHHPCTLWAGACEENYRWLWEHMGALLAEFTRRYGKHHAWEPHWAELWERRPDLPKLGRRTPFAQCMPEQYRVPEDAVKAYRAYYKGEKAGFAKWKTGNCPVWFGEP